MSLVILSALGETINIMTLGGFALAVGILVDDATVEIENINRNIDEGKEIEKAILDGASQIAVPAFVSTLSICIVFVPMFFLTGVARYLFVPLAEAVVFAMLASYFLSRTLVPTMARFLLRGHEHDAEEVKHGTSSGGVFVRLQRGFEERFETLPRRVQAAARVGSRSTRPFAPVPRPSARLRRPAAVRGSGGTSSPRSTAGQIKLHLRAPDGNADRGDGAPLRRDRRPSGERFPPASSPQ